MPIPRELRHFYRTRQWEEARERVRVRAGDRCEWCGKPNHERVESVVGKVLVRGHILRFMFWRLPDAKE